MRVLPPIHGVTMLPIGLLLVILAVCSTNADEFPTPEFLEAIKPVMDKCREETGVDRGILQHFSEGKMPEDQKLKCYMKCMFLEFEVLDVSTGEVHYEKMMTFIPEKMKRIAYNMGKNCIHIKGEGDPDLCQLSYDIHKCWQQADPESLDCHKIFLLEKYLQARYFSHIPKHYFLM